MFSIFKVFFGLGWISFGGPAAHIGYFRQTFVEKLNWLSDKDYAQIVALSQFLPGPGSSQVGFAIGYKKGGVSGACMAFLGFTLPSILIMLLLAVLSSQLTESPLFQNVVHGLKLLAVVVVADATWGMYKNFCQSRLSITLCVITALGLLLIPSIGTQVSLLLLCGMVGAVKLQDRQTQPPSPHKISLLPLSLFALLLFGLPIINKAAPEIGLFSDFFQAGSLVFGGGHVVLPLLQNIVGDQLTQEAFLTGYATAQAVPGPMFTFATYIGYQLLPNTPIFGALLATLAVFLPGFLLLLSVLKNWQTLASNALVSGALNGINASVVGLLLSALYQPVFVSAVISGLDIAAVILGFYLLKQWKIPIIYLVLLFAVSRVGISHL